MTRDTHSIFESYVSSLNNRKVVAESTETDPAKIAATDPANDGARVTEKDRKIANYLSKKHKAIAKAISRGKEEAEEEENEKNNSLHGDALFIWDYLLHKKRHSPTDAIKIIDMAKTSFEHLLQ